MLKATHPTKGNVLATEVAELELETPDPHDLDWRCTVDDCRMQFVDAEKRIKHFRHYEEPDHVTSEESEEHRNLIITLAPIYEKANYAAEVKVEEYIEPIDRIADLLLTKQSGAQIVIEVQLSNQSKQQFIQRTRDYHNRGYYTLWLLGVQNYLNEKYTGKRHGYRYTDVHKWMKTQYYGRHYTVMESFDGIEVNPTRYESKEKHVESYKGHGGYTKPYKTLARISGIELTKQQLEPMPQEKEGDYYDDIQEFDVATFGEEPWW